MEACPSAEFKRALVHTGAVDQKGRTSIHSGVERALELIGTRTLPDAMRATRVQRVVCFTGCFASNGSSSAADLLAAVLQRFIYLNKSGPDHCAYRPRVSLRGYPRSHAAMEAGTLSENPVVAINKGRCAQGRVIVPATLVRTFPRDHRCPWPRHPASAEDPASSPNVSRRPCCASSRCAGGAPR